MRVKRKTALAGADFSIRPGTVMEVPDAVGESWIESGHAVATDEAATQAWPPDVGTATAPAPEKAVARNKRKRK